MELEDYAKRVLFYVRNPGKEPMLEVMSEDAAREAGMPSAEECARLLERAVDDAEQEEKAHYAGFDDDEKSAATTTGGTGKKRAPRLGEARGAVLGSGDLAQDVTDARRRTNTSQGRAEAAHRRESQEGRPAADKPAAGRAPSSKGAGAGAAKKPKPA